MARPRLKEVEQALLEHVFWGSASPVRQVARQFGLARQTVHQYVRRLIQEQKLMGSGGRRWRHYQLRHFDQDTREFALKSGLNEDRVWNEFIREKILEIGTNEQEILHYGLTEMVNNAMDHSEGQKVTAHFWRTAVSVTLRVADDGVGIFRRFRENCSFAIRDSPCLNWGKANSLQIHEGTREKGCSLRRVHLTAFLSVRRNCCLRGWLRQTIGSWRWRIKRTTVLA